MGSRNLHPLGLIVLLVLIVAVALAVGCGDSSDQSASTQSASTATTGTAQLHDLLPQDMQESGVLKIGTDAEYPPYEYFEPGSQVMKGFEVDLWTALAEKLGLKPEASSIQFAGLLPGVQSGRFDVAIEAITDMVEREARLTFVDYAVCKGGILTLQSNTSVTDDPMTLAGKSLGVQTGTDFVNDAQSLSDYVVSNGGDAVKVIQFPSEAQVLLGVKSGRVDAALDDLAAAAYLLKKSSTPLRLTPTDFSPAVYIGIAISKDNTSLQKAVLAGLQQLWDDGTYEKIMKDWGVDGDMIDAPGINLTTTKPIQDAE